MKDYPHKCPTCKSPAYIGLNKIDCSYCNRNDIVIIDDGETGSISTNPITFHCGKCAKIMTILYHHDNAFCYKCYSHIIIVPKINRWYKSETPTDILYFKYIGGSDLVEESSLITIKK